MLAGSWLRAQGSLLKVAWHGAGPEGGDASPWLTPASLQGNMPKKGTSLETTNTTSLLPPDAARFIGQLTTPEPKMKQTKCVWAELAAH